MKDKKRAASLGGDVTNNALNNIRGPGAIRRFARSCNC
jgi:hypothetical protein